MVHTTQLVNPILTPIETPVHVVLPLTDGMLEKVSILFPDGCYGLVGFWMTHHGIKIFPYNPAGILYGNDATIEFNMNFKMNTHPYDLELFSFNNDDRYPHILYISVNLLPFVIEQSSTLYTEV